MNVHVIDYGMCNLGSLCHLLEELKYRPIICTRPEEAVEATHLILPGVGSFNRGYLNLQNAGWPAFLKQSLEQPGKSLLGICLGMQLLATSGNEGEKTDGLGFIDGHVEKMTPMQGERIPHVGWNHLTNSTGAALFAGIPNEADFYFIHSFHFNVTDPADVIGRVDYAGGVVAAVKKGNVQGVQFHPEKSSWHGRQLLKNFLENKSC